ncbi:uncharacterized protein [Parasteatoda tepidariorum]|uniref:uncharacterized protein isoform X2 n=1 Tax=Parasteatoda tepidariorum TaxID=114398 RepID=UPI00077FD35C|nr:uncharacterized protein LOC107440198 isoform X2 [Parasteatoda tepidariorum]
MISSFQIIFFCVTFCVVTNAFDAGKLQPLTPSEEEKEICKDNAYGREITFMYKKVWNTCHIQCLYEGESKAEAFFTPDGQLCCDIVGIGPTGDTV